MTIYVPLIFFETEGEEKQICDVVLRGFYTRRDAEEIHPEAEIIQVEAEINPLLN